ncbi:hypothetical protein [Sciscionella sediminilitoris]|uniref:hypothetical protein n=1 Tax=Sciscionella sediminilitoris TaxID=1445613 RepID=UPI00055A40E4|nr:hypothetical protein [Sciscionella sp. SE31]
MAGEFGVTPWGRAWLRTVESARLTAPEPALPRARNMARNAEVPGPRVTPGLVEAEVRGHPVRIEVPPFEDRETVVRLRAEYPAGAPGELADELHERLTEQGIGLAELGEQHCGCASRKPRCVHLLATLYALTRRIDEEPRLALTVRGVAPDQENHGWIALAEVPVAGFYTAHTLD